MVEFKVNKFFPVRDVEKLRDLAKEGVILYPLLISLNSEDVKYAIAVLKANKLKIAAVIHREMIFEDPVYNYKGFVEYLIENKINLLTYEELLSTFNFITMVDLFGYEKAEKYERYDLSGFFELKDGDKETKNPIPISVLLYIRYIQQDGKL